MARLILTFNNNILSTHMISPGQQLNIGRHPNNPIVIDNLAVSAHHAAIRLDGQKLILTDMGSRNGTLVNNERVTECHLAHQDWITIGKHFLIVDLHETLSLEGTADQLMAHAPAIMDADQTMVIEREEAQPQWLGFDYLSFISGGREDYELSDQPVTIGKQDADIKISGFWALLAGEPSVTITKKHEGYFLEYKGGMLKPKINDDTVTAPTKLNHEDIIKVGPIELQIRFVRRPAK
ncbi:MAG: FHA domain-containing protein [Desulfobacterales bacterium]|nr:FHA domain-containing protein [Desulfobacterales bacterium]